MLVAVLAGIVVPQFSAGVADARTKGASRYLVGRLHGARVQSVAEGTTFGARVLVRGRDIYVRTFRDGNRNGLRAADVAAGVDVPVDEEVGLGDLFAGVRIGAEDGSEPPPVAGEVSTWFSFTPSGTSSSGTVYLRGAGAEQYAVRVLGATGRIRILRFRRTTAEWVDAQ